MAIVGECNHCGQCCEGVFGNGRCEHYDADAEHHCRIYDTRPAVCREWPPTPEKTKTYDGCGFHVEERVDAETERT